MDNYLKYRGKCKEMSEELVKNNPDLRLVRGHYYCPIWNKDEQHWWTVDKDGTIVDPTKFQFPSVGFGHYKEFDGYIECEMCCKKVSEDDAQFYGRYACCSYDCIVRMVL